MALEEPQGYQGISQDADAGTGYAGALCYASAVCLTMWSLTLPQAATALVAFHTYDPAGQRLLDRQTLAVVLALMCTTATLGPVLTQHFAPRMLVDPAAKAALNGGVP